MSSCEDISYPWAETVVKHFFQNSCNSKILVMKAENDIQSYDQTMI